MSFKPLRNPPMPKHQKQEPSTTPEPECYDQPALGPDCCACDSSLLCSCTSRVGKSHSQSRSSKVSSAKWENQLPSKDVRCCTGYHEGECSCFDEDSQNWKDSVSFGGQMTPSASTASGAGLREPADRLSWDEPLNQFGSPEALENEPTEANRSASTVQCASIPFSLLRVALSLSSLAETVIEPDPFTATGASRSDTTDELPLHLQDHRLFVDVDYDSQELRIFARFPSASGQFVKTYLSILASVRSVSCMSGILNTKVPTFPYRNIFRELMTDHCDGKLTRTDRLLMYAYLSVIARRLQLSELQDIADDFAQQELNAAQGLDENADDVGPEGIIELIKCVVANPAPRPDDDQSNYRDRHDTAGVISIEQKFGRDRLSEMVKAFLAKNLAVYRFHPDLQDLLAVLPRFCLELLLQNPIPVKKPSELAPAFQFNNTFSDDDSLYSWDKEAKDFGAAPESDQKSSVAEYSRRHGESGCSSEAQMKVSSLNKLQVPPIDDTKTDSAVKKTSKKTKKTKKVKKVKKVKKIKKTKRVSWAESKNEWDFLPVECTSKGLCGYLAGGVCFDCNGKVGGCVQPWERKVGPEGVWRGNEFWRWEAVNLLEGWDECGRDYDWYFSGPDEYYCSVCDTDWVGTKECGYGCSKPEVSEEW
ncbi:hypothetical protein BJ508DRAFT_325493 [Ascobolus immersus RN42]|uniref:Uncharacterized protein n=1 Tax=Ascobolus immersus RN42 TaxID=1160509 RepID=A0A3N4IE49_ASCIM|nr:hypothetical protein BJ508DRAFT_325493 [Ascobolus immersus RN42]